MITSIKKWGNSQGLRFSKETLEAIGIKVNDEVNVEVKDHRIVISKVEEKKINLKTLFQEYDGNYTGQEVDWGKPKGDEIW